MSRFKRLAKEVSWIIAGQISRDEMAHMVVTFPVFLLHHVIYAIGPILKQRSKLSFKKQHIRLHWLFASQFGLDPQRSLRGLPVFLRDSGNANGYTVNVSVEQK